MRVIVRERRSGTTLGVAVALIALSGIILLRRGFDQDTLK